jgi:hypothetical protein
MRRLLTTSATLAPHTGGAAIVLESRCGAGFHWDLPMGHRCISTDGPWKWQRPRFVEKKKHYGQVLVTADRRKLLETVQDVLNEPNLHYGGRFWEVMSKRCIRCMHLFKPLELAMIARAFDVHDVEMKGLNVFKAIAERARSVTSGFPGLAVLVLADVLSRRLRAKGSGRWWPGTQDLMQRLGRHASNCMWELRPEHAIQVLGVLSDAEVKDPAICARVASKVKMQLDSLKLESLVQAAIVFASHQHRDLELLRGIAEQVAARCYEHPDNEALARRVLGSFVTLEIDDAPEVLLKAAGIDSLDHLPHSSE